MGAWAGVRSGVGDRTWSKIIGVNLCGLSGVSELKDMRGVKKPKPKTLNPIMSLRLRFRVEVEVKGLGSLQHGGFSQTPPPQKAVPTSRGV